MTKKRLLLLRISLVIGSIVFTTTIICLALEIHLRKTYNYIVPRSGIISSGIGPIIRETAKGRRMQPNINVVIRNQRLSLRDIPFRTNSLGFRGEEIPTNKNPDDLRILFLGDSITQAEHLLEEEIYLARLKIYLQEKIKSKNIQVFNAGVGDIGLKEEIDILEESVVRVKPDLVIVGFYLNDSRPPWGFPQELGKPGWLRQHSLLADKLYRNLKLYQFISNKGLSRMQWLTLSESDWKQDRNLFMQLVKEANVDWGAAWDPNSWKTVGSEFSRLKELSQKHQFKVVIISFPVRFQVYAQYLEDYPQQMMESQAKYFTFHHFDLLPILRLNTNMEYFYDWCHPQPHANDLIGKELASFLKKEIYSDIN